MISKKYVLNFPTALTDKAITYHLVKDYDLVVNILRANVDAEAIGRLLVELTGDEAKVREGLDYLRNSGVLVEVHSNDISWNSEKCVDCGACTGVCRPEALRLNHDTWKLEFDRSRCVLCSLCVEACPVGAFEVEL
jgi:ferredoxin